MRNIDVHEIADQARFGKLHLSVLAWCGLILVIDGYDLQLVGIALPAIMKEMQVSSGLLSGLMVTSAVLGMCVGSVVLGTLADRFGRRRIIAGCVVLFSAFTAAAAFTKDPVSFMAMRFVAGMGLGGVVPAIVATMTEYSPLKLRATLVTVAFTGTALGGVLAAAVAKALLATYGWQSMFLGAVLPVLLLPLMFRSMPESMSFLLKRGRTSDVLDILKQLAPAYEHRTDDRLAIRSAPAGGATSTAQLFSEGRARSTVMFWLAMFMCLLATGALYSSLTRILAQAGYSMDLTLTSAMAMHSGVIAGTLVGGWLADRFQLRRVILMMFAIGVASVLVLGSQLGGGAPEKLVLLLAALVGASVIGTQLLTVAYAGTYYPTSISATGIGWMGGLGRLGAIVSPIAMGVLLDTSLGAQRSFLLIAVPAVIALLAVWRVDDAYSVRAKRAALPSEPAGAASAPISRSPRSAS